jgi:hypothetical protein
MDMEIKEMLKAMKMFLIGEGENPKTKEILFVVLDETDPTNTQPEIMTYSDIVQRYNEFKDQRFDF